MGQLVKQLSYMKFLFVIAQLEAVAVCE